MGFRPIKTRKIYEEIVNNSKRHAQPRGIMSGDRLPSEREMAESLGKPGIGPGKF